MIKKFLSVILLLLVIFSTPVYAEGIYVNNEIVDAPSISSEGVTLVPLRAIFQALGAQVNWDQETQTVSAVKGKITIQLKIESSMAYVNNKPVSLLKPATIVNGSTMVPLRFVSESLGAKVDWYAFNKTVYIYSDFQYLFPKEITTRQWKKHQSQYFDVRYYQDEQFVKNYSRELDYFYEKAYEEYKHKPRTFMPDSDLIPLAFINEEDMKKVVAYNPSGIWNSNGYMLINLVIKEWPHYTTIMPLIIKHELAHALTIDSIDSKAMNIPGWLKEGEAETFVQISYVISSYINIVRDASEKNTLIPWSKLQSSSGSWNEKDLDLAYGQSWSIYNFLIDKYGKEKIRNIFYTDGNALDILRNITGRSMAELESDWKKYIAEEYKHR